MNKLPDPYVAQFPAGTSVKVAGLDALKVFRQEWKCHHLLVAEQLEYAGKVAFIESVGYSSWRRSTLSSRRGAWNRASGVPAPSLGCVRWQSDNVEEKLPFCERPNCHHETREAQVTNTIANTLVVQILFKVEEKTPDQLTGPMNVPLTPPAQ
jgi:hypothetical protein